MEKKIKETKHIAVWSKGPEAPVTIVVRLVKTIKIELNKQITMEINPVCFGT